MSKLWYIIFGLTAIIILLLIFQPNPPPADTTVWKQEIEKNRQKAEELAIKHREDSTQFAQKLAQLNAELKGKERQVVKLEGNLSRLKKNPVVIKVKDSIPEIDSVFQQYDLLLETKDNQISIQSKMIKGLEEENTRITDNFLERLQLSQAAFDNQKLIADSYKKDTRKVRRQNKLLKVAAVVGTVGGIFLGAQF